MNFIESCCRTESVSEKNFSSPWFWKHMSCMINGPKMLCLFIARHYCLVYVWIIVWSICTFQANYYVILKTTNCKKMRPSYYEKQYNFIYKDLWLMQLSTYTNQTAQFCFTKNKTKSNGVMSFNKINSYTGYITL